MRIRKPIKRKTRLKPISDKRKAEHKTYMALRAVFLAKSHECQVCQKAKAKDVHHKKGRHSGNYLNTETWLAVCRPCHRWIHDNPAKAREQGFLDR